MAQTLAAVFALNDQYSVAMKRIINSTDTADKKVQNLSKVLETEQKRLDGLKKSSDTAATGIGGLATKISGLVSVAYLGKKALDGMFAAINTSALQDIQETTFQSLLNSEKIGTQLYQYVGAYAKASALSREQVATATTSFLNVTRDIDQIEQLIGFVERLQAKDPTKGAEQAVFSIRELLAGDTVSARGVYGITGISGEQLRGLKDKGDIAGMLDIIESGLNSVGATVGVVEKNFNGLITQTDVFKSNMMTAIGEAATPVMENLAGVVQRLNENMAAGNYQPFIAVMVNGMDMIGNGIAWVADNAGTLVPTLAGVMTALIIYNGVMKIVKGTTELLGITTGILTGNWIKAAAALAAFAGGAYVVSELTKEVDMETSQSLASLKDQLGTGLSGTADIDAKITNTDPIKVTGEVEIEKETMRYMMEATSQKFFAQFSTATLAPQVNIYGQTIEKTADSDEVIAYLSAGLKESTELQAQGVYE